MFPLLLSFLFLSLCQGDVLLRKAIGLSIDNPTPILDTDLLMTLQVFNRGDSPVYDLQITDYVPKEFDVVYGSVKPYWPELAPGANYTHTYVLRSSKLGYVRFSWATMTYKPTLSSQDALVYSNYLGTAEVISGHSRLERGSNPNLLSWFVFGVLYATLVGVPYYLYQQSNDQFMALSKSRVDQ